MPPVEGQGAVETITGEVAETIDAANYTYLRVKAPKGDVWVATAKTSRCRRESRRRARAGDGELPQPVAEPRFSADLLRPGHHP